MRDYRIWVELAQGNEKCHRCDGEIFEGTMFIRFGDRSSPCQAFSICAPCFEGIMEDLFNEYQEMRSSVQQGEMGLGPCCFGCGNLPERCRCGHEAYR